MNTARTGGAGRGSDDWVERVRAASDIVAVIGESVSLKRVGRNWVGLCPFHKEKTPSFSVNAERQFYHCFSCKAGGDVFTFIEQNERLGFREAVEWLSRRAGIPIPERGRGESRGARTRIAEALEAAATAYEQWLADPARGAQARAYLESRGLARETIRAFRLGLAPAGWENLSARLRDRFPEEALMEAGLALKRDGGRGAYDRFRNRLMVPLIAPGGTVVGFGARALAAEDNPKYLNSPETAVYHKGSFLFGLDAARRPAESAGEMIVVEGYFDAIALHQAGFANTVATSGTALTSEQAKLLRRVTGRVALTFDGDAAGQDAMMRSFGVLMAEGLDVVVMDLPAQDDPDTLLRREGPEGWRARRAQAADPVEFIQRHMLRAPARAGEAAARDPRERAMRAVIALGAALRDPVQLALLGERAERVLGIAPRVLQQSVALARRGQAEAAPVAGTVQRQRGIASSVERHLLRALLAAPGVLDDARRQLAPEDFEDATAASLAAVLWAGADPVRADDAAAASLARELSAGADRALDWEAEARGALRRLRVRRLRREQRDVEQHLRRAQEPPELERWMRHLHDISNELKTLSNA